jgi:hypothetical protein
MPNAPADTTATVAVLQNKTQPHWCALDDTVDVDVDVNDVIAPRPVPVIVVIPPLRSNTPAFIMMRVTVNDDEAFLRSGSDQAKRYSGSVFS